MVELFDDRILLIPDPAETVTEGGIIIPDSVTEFEKKKKGTVIAHGNGYVDQQTGELLPISVYVGCRVSFAAHLGEEMSATDMEIEEGKYLLINERDIDCMIYEWGDNDHNTFESKYSNLGLFVASENKNYYKEQLSQSQVLKKFFDTPIEIGKK